MNVVDIIIRRRLCVIEQVKVVKLNVNTLNLLLTKQYTLYDINAEPGDTRVWSSSNPSIVSVVNGVVTGVSKGTATITCTNPVTGSFDTCVVTADNFTVTPSSTYIVLERSKNVSFTVKAGDVVMKRTLVAQEWEIVNISDPNKAHVSGASTNQITFDGKGTIDVTFRALGQYAGLPDVTVTLEAAHQYPLTDYSVTMCNNTGNAYPSIIVYDNSTITLKVTKTPFNANIPTDAVFESNDESVVTGDFATSTLTTHGTGEAVIKFKSVADEQEFDLIKVIVVPTPTTREFVSISGKRVANMNFGANTVDEIGNLYAWGETFTKDEYTLATYTLNGNWTTLASADCMQWDKSVYDPVYIASGGSEKICLPDELVYAQTTVAQFNCTHNGVAGAYIWDNSSKQCIFIPMSGKYLLSSFIGYTRGIGGTGNSYYNGQDASGKSCGPLIKSATGITLADLNTGTYGYTSRAYRPMLV